MASDSPPISVDGLTKEENLPLPSVQYPSHYGAFIAFSTGGDSPPFLCSCSKPAVKNFLHLNDLLVNPDKPTDQFPEGLVETLPQNKNLSLEAFEYEEGICHRCNIATPSVRYCHEMYGSKFKQRYGWYIEQAKYRLGFNRAGYLESVCPPEIQELIDRQTSLSHERQRLVDQGDESSQRVKEIDKEARSVRREISNYAENVARREFGHHEIGEKWTSETVLAQIVDRLLPSHEIVRHHRPDWLEGLELDIWIPELDLGIEYQGQQHFHPVEVWGGEEALEEQQKRDQRTRTLCDKHNVQLLEIDYRDSLTSDLIRQELRSIGVPNSELS